MVGVEESVERARHSPQSPLLTAADRFRNPPGADAETAFRPGTTEFGRLPDSQSARGRDHDPFGFTTWLAADGIQGGVTHGATDEWSFRAVENPTYCYDVHATALHLLGIDHQRLTVRHDGTAADRRPRVGDRGGYRSSERRRARRYLPMPFPLIALSASASSSSRRW